MYLFLDYAFVILHSSLILFNLTGWAWKRTRRVHLIIIGSTIASWFGLGIFYGWGYCPLTDWHWDIKQTLGETYLPNSFVMYYGDKLTGLTLDPFAVDAAVFILGLLAFLLSCWLNFKASLWNRHV
jgi:uncharacterized membrane protein (Fun14 family)